MLKSRSKIESLKSLYFDGIQVLRNFSDRISEKKNLIINLIVILICFSVNQRSRKSTVRRMGAWVNDRVVEEEVVLRVVQDTRKRSTTILGSSCDGGGGRLQARSSSSLLPLRRQFTRQLYEWPITPLFKSRTKLVNFKF